MVPGACDYLAPPAPDMAGSEIPRGGIQGMVWVTPDVHSDGIPICHRVLPNRMYVDIVCVRWALLRGNAYALVRGGRLYAADVHVAVLRG